MFRKSFFKLAVLFLFGFTTYLYAEPSINATLDGTEYSIGDILTVNVDLEEVTQYHGLFFELNYNSEALTFDGISKGEVFYNESKERDLLYSNSTMDKGRVIVSYSLKGKDLSTNENGRLLQIRFKVTGKRTEGDGFTFSNQGIQDGVGKPKTGLQWNISSDYSVYTPINTSYITIKNPYENQVFYNDIIEIDAIFNFDTGYTVVFQNMDTPYTSSKIDAVNGFISGEKINIKSGYNRIIASLYNEKNELMAQDRVNIYKSEDTDYIRIVSPSDHSHLNRNLVTVEVESPFGNVSINGVDADLAGGISSIKTFKKYKAQVWLKDGYNRVTAMAVSENGAIFKHTISLFYQQDGEIFEIVKPYEGQILKSGGDLEITGEISSLFTANPISIYSRDKNTVHISVVYYPADSLEQPVTIINKEAVSIEEASPDDDFRTSYIFNLKKDLSLFSNLDKGKLEIIALQNLFGNNNRVVSRFVSLDDSWLSIDLIQPNIYGKYLLDSADIILKMDPYKENDFEETGISNLVLNEKGEFVLESGSMSVSESSTIKSGIPGNLIQTLDGDFYGLTNSYGTMELYRKKTDDEYELVFSKADMYGYSLCETDNGILVGVSNLYSNDNSGLYILEENISGDNSAFELVNIQMEAPISFVQFIKNIQGQIFLYGNSYSNVYSFGINSLEEENGVYKVDSVNSYPLDIDFPLSQFVIARDGDIALLLSETGKVNIYRKGLNGSYDLVAISDGFLEDSFVCDLIVSGEDFENIYNTYLLLGENNGDKSNKVLMENKLTGRFSVNDLASSLDRIDITCAQTAGFNGENFVFGYRSNSLVDSSDFTIVEASVFFDEIKEIGEPVEFNNESGISISFEEKVELFLNGAYKSFVKKSGINEWNFINLETSYKASGSAEINYWNPSVDGITGFSFYIDPQWLESDMAENINLGFELNNIKVSGKTLSEFLADTSEYTVQHYYDSLLKKEYVYVEFNDLEQTDSFSDSTVLKLNFSLKSLTMNAPSISGITVYNKSPFRLYLSGEPMNLPIRGNVFDPTVSIVKIGQEKVVVDRNRAFSYNYPLDSLSEKIVPIEISCTNSSMDEAKLSFNVEILDSFNEITGLDIYKDQDLTEKLDLGLTNNILVDNSVYISGSYFGMKDCIVGYEIYKGSNNEANSENSNDYLITSDVFTDKKETGLDEITNFSEYPGINHENKSRYESGTFKKEILLDPGKQTIVVYVENPGGKRSRFNINKQYPQIIYNISEENQKISITNIENNAHEINGFEYDKVEIPNKIKIDVVEDDNPPYDFIREYTLEGKINSLYNLKELIIKSSNGIALFENGEKEIRVPVSIDNTFEIPLTITMQERSLSDNFFITITPSDTFMNGLKTGVEFFVEKNFESSHISPDFTTMKPFNWTESELKNLEKPFYINFSKYLPNFVKDDMEIVSEGVEVSFLVNYEKYISGNLELVDETKGLYRVVDIYGNQVNLDCVRPGNNLIYWSLSYMGYIISSSDNPFMNDFELNLDLSDVEYKPTKIEVTNLENVEYILDKNNLPEVNITKDETTTTKIKLNGPVVDLDDQILQSLTVDLKSINVLQGKNNLVVECYEKIGGLIREEYTFNYDTEKPKISVESITFTDTDKTQADLSVLINEANLTEVKWKLGDSDYTNDKLNITYVSDDVYRIVISDLAKGEEITIQAKDVEDSHTAETEFLIESLLSDKSSIVSMNILDSTSGNSFIQSKEDDSLSDSPFSNKVDYSKFFPSSITLGGVLNSYMNNEDDKTFKIALEDKIVINNSMPNGYTTDIESKEIHLGKNFRAESNFNAIASVIEHPEVKIIEHDKQSNSMTISFWFRYEFMDYYMENQDNQDMTSFPVLSLPGNQTLETDGEYISLNSSGTERVAISKTGWNFISLLISNGVNDNDGKITLLSRNENSGGYNEVSKTAVSTSIVESILEKGAQYFFGGTNKDSGYFSIAYPNYINRLLTYNDVIDLDNPSNSKISALSSIYNFNIANGPMADDFNSDSYIQGESEDSLDAFVGLDGMSLITVNTENVNYIQNGDRSLIATAGHKNLLEIRNNEISFASPDSENQDSIITGETENLTVIGDMESDYLNLYSENIFIKGRYYFGKKQLLTPLNYLNLESLSDNEVYTISGYVQPVIEDGTEFPIDSRIIVSVNGIETGFELEKGDFNILINPEELEIKSDSFFNIILETDRGVRLNKDIKLNRGNFSLPFTGETMETPAAAKRDYTFQLEGSVDFWYKPFNINKDGFSNYESVLFDSDSFRIKTVKKDSEIAVYQVDVKTGNDENGIESFTSTTPVFGGWNHIQLSYTTEEVLLEGDITQTGEVVLCINGKFADKISKKPVLKGDEETIYIGCSKESENRIFAEGFIDNIQLSPLFKGDDFTDFVPFLYSFDSETNELQILEVDKKVNLDTVESAMYILESCDRDYKQSTSLEKIEDQVTDFKAHGFDIESLDPGRYRLKTEMVINNYNYENTYYFIKHDRPAFFLKDKTPFIIIGDSNRVNFKVQYDMPEIPVENKESGIAVKIEGRKTNGQSYFDTRYLVKRESGWEMYNQEDLSVAGDTVEDTTNSIIEVSFTDLDIGSKVSWDIRTFYLEENADPVTFSSLPEWKSGEINSIDLIIEQEKLEDGTEYKLLVGIVTEETEYINDILDRLSLNYSITSSDNSYGISRNGSKSFSGTNGQVELFYDEIIPAFGNYKGIFSLYFDGKAILSHPPVNIHSEKPENIINTGTKKNLKIDEFSVISIDDSTEMAKVMVRYSHNAIYGEISYSIDVYQNNVKLESDTGTLEKTKSSEMFNIQVPEGNSELILKITGSSLENSRTAFAVNNTEAPEIVLVNTHPYLITYNNISFGWYGQINGVINNNIIFYYNMDDKGWIPTGTVRSREFSNLDEGNHSFSIKATYNDVDSLVRTASFFVDTENPQIDISRILVEPQTGEDGIISQLKISGNAGAVTDVSLSNVAVDGYDVNFSVDGSFSSITIPVEMDGLNEIIVSACDSAGNISDQIVEFENSMIEILYPRNEEVVKYTPLTLVGKISSEISSMVEVYVKDPTGSLSGTQDYSTWKKARINSDRTFFVEDLYITPGKNYRTVDTVLDVALVTESGKIFRKDVTVRASELIHPLDIILSSHAVEGESDETTIEIDCSAVIDNIASWSIDFDGDGIYDVIDIVKGNDDGKNHSWTHSYSSLGLVKPRVRAITDSGKYFSVSDELIIHEQFNQSTNTMVENPVSMSTVRKSLNEYNVFILSEKDNLPVIDVFEIGANKDTIGDRLDRIEISEYPQISNPTKIVTIDGKTIYIVSNNRGKAEIQMLQKNSLGTYLYVQEAFYSSEEVEGSVNDTINDLAVDENYIYITYKNNNIMTKIRHIDYFPVFDKESDEDPDPIENITPEIPGDSAPGNAMAIFKDRANVYSADYYNQRMLVFNEKLDVMNYFGGFGTDEGNFIKPKMVRKNSGRIFVYDEGRSDIQVFNEEFNLITELSPDNENGHIEDNLLVDVADIQVITKEESGKIFFYVLVLSKSTNKLSIVKLPEWEEMRVRVKNNRIVFLQNKEVFSAKPSGSDLKKVLSTDSIPSIEGDIDYPALGPDGSKLVFVSRSTLYNGEKSETEETSLYNNLYVVDVDDPESLFRIPLDGIEKFEIERPVFNTNGTKLIFSARAEGKNWQIYTYNFLTGGIERLFTSNENARFPYYSPDDRFVVFTTDADGDEEIEILDTQNSAVRVEVTSNNAKDSMPVWSELYPFESTVEDYNTQSKIAFVSEKDFEKTINYVYIADITEITVESDDEDEENITTQGSRILKIVGKNGENSGNDPDSVRIAVTKPNEEADYPCITGDGSHLIYEGRKDYETLIKDFDLTKIATVDYGSSTLNFPERSLKPAGMKNRISNFNIENVDGNNVKLTWDRYTDFDITYYIEFRRNNSTAVPTVVKVYSQNSIVLSDFEMGTEYLFRVFVEENGEEVTTTQLTKYKTPNVVAIPSFQVDEDNPYIVKLNAWQPSADSKWEFTWIIDNKEIPVMSLEDYYYEFATSGTKVAVLKAATKGNTNISISEPVYIDIVSDIKPVIEYKISSDTSYIDLDASNSLGKENIDWSATEWEITGPGNIPFAAKGKTTMINLSKYKEKIYVRLTLRRNIVEGQQNVDSIEKTIVVDLEYEDVKPVITYQSNEMNERLLTFSGNNSFGNIDWLMAKWQVFADGAVIHSEAGVSSFNYLFAETGADSNYSVSLSVPRPDNDLTETANVHVTIGASPIIPEIDYEILRMEQDGNITGTKILLSCGKSKGSNIDYSQARWNLPIASKYGEQSSQVGPTAVYNLLNIEESSIIEASITLMKRGGSDPVTVTKMITLTADELPPVEISVNIEREHTSEGEMIVFDILSSTGPNINWDATTWQFDTITKTGSVARVDRSISGDSGLIAYVCSVFIQGAETPIVKIGTVTVEAGEIKPVIGSKFVEEGSQTNMYELSVLETKGISIDWSKTEWFIPDGNNGQINKQGGKIYHVFPYSSEPKIYRLMVNMYYKGDGKPFTGYKTIMVSPDFLTPVITVENKGDVVEKTSDGEHITRNRNIRYFSAEDSLGENINWADCKWNFGDTGASAVGESVMYEFAHSTENKQYDVSLTISRNMSNGEVETSTRRVTIMIDGDYINPKITCELETGSTRPNVYTLSVKSSIGTRIDWSRTRWDIETRSTVVNLSDAEVLHLFENQSNEQKYTIKAHMYLLEDNTPFTAKIVHKIDADPLSSNFSVSKVDGINRYRFDGSSSVGSGIQYEWDFGNGEKKTGPVVYYSFPIRSQKIGYNVELRVHRTLSDGVIDEDVVVYKEDIKGFVIIPDIAEESKLISREIVGNTELMNNQLNLSALGTEHGDLIDWSRTKWTGYQVVDSNLQSNNDGAATISAKNAKIIQTIPVEKIDTRYYVRVELFLIGDYTPFTTDKIIEIPGYNYQAHLTSHLFLDDDGLKDNKNYNIYKYSMGNSTGSNILHNECIWTVTPSEGSSVSNNGIGEEVTITLSESGVYTIVFDLYATYKGTKIKADSITRRIDYNTITPRINQTNSKEGYSSRYVILDAKESRGIGIDIEQSKWYIFKQKVFSRGSTGNKFDINLDKAYKSYTGSSIQIDDGDLDNMDDPSYFWAVLELSRTRPDGKMEYSYILKGIEGYRGDCVICTELYYQGRMPEEIYIADEQFGKVMRDTNRFIMVGYHSWGKTVVKWMRKSETVTDIAEAIAMPWAYEMAYRMGVTEEGNILGKVLMGVGIPICIAIGFLVTYKWVALLLLIGYFAGNITLIVRLRRKANV